MRKFTDNQHLMNYIKCNNIIDLREELLNTIFFLKGDREEMENAIEYAINHSDFQFDNHIEIKLENVSSLEDEYIEEAINIKQNFSRERMNRLLQLYDLFYAKNEVSPLITEKESSSKIEIKKIVGLAIGVAVVSYLIYKMLD